MKYFKITIFHVSGLRRWLKAPFRKGVGSNPTGITFCSGAGAGCSRPQARRCLRVAASRRNLLPEPGWLERDAVNLQVGSSSFPGTIFVVGFMPRLEQMHTESEQKGGDAMAGLPQSAERKAHGGFEPHGGCFASLAQRRQKQGRVKEALSSP